LAGCDLSSNIFGGSSDDKEVTQKKVIEKKAVALDTEDEDEGDASEAIAYNDNLIELIDQCAGAVDDFFEVLDSDDDELTDEFPDIFENAVVACQDAQEQLQNYASFEWDTSFADAIDEYLSVENELLGNYLDYFSLEEDLDEETEDQFWEAMEDLGTSADTLYEQIITAQEKFAEKHGFDLED